MILLIVFIVFRRSIADLAKALTHSLERGAAVRVGSFFSIGVAPKKVREGAPGSAAVSDSDKGVELPKDLSTSELDEEYNRLKHGFFLVDATQVVVERTTPKSGRYQVRVWVESLDPKTLNEITRVTYRIWDDFNPPIIATTSRETNFDVWLNVYGEFPVLAYIEAKTRAPVCISRYIDLPGRPLD
jgi:hypothetical protein